MGFDEILEDKTESHLCQECGEGNVAYQKDSGYWECDVCDTIFRPKTDEEVLPSHLRKIDELDKASTENDMTEWELTFISDLKEKKPKTLTDRQVDVLERLFEKYVK